ncbi:MAG: aminodeoxychorismate synthase component I [Gammaproteobacteria bacterium]|nr:aminodeoxychorismate synthase component I [Gammaproteobacteria bacterium]MDH5727763.1 aminodeoxychorismate synthase component I [Gammaproteobacteria bacterium]
MIVKQLDQTIDLLNLHQLNPSRYPFLLQSTAQGGDNARFDILFALPQNQLVLSADQQLFYDQEVLSGERDFLSKFDTLVLQHQPRNKAEFIDLPFRGGWFIFLAYEVAQQIEPVLSLPQAYSFPRAFAVRMPAAYIFDHHSQQLFLMIEDAFAEHEPILLNDFEKAAQAAIVKTSLGQFELVEADEHAYLDAVNTIKNYIHNGDVFQVNLSRLWQAKFQQTPDAVDIYRRLRLQNPAPFAGLANWSGQSIISSSPERLVDVKNNWASTRPIAGTSPRNLMSHEHDSQLKQRLVQHPKERAEHVMLIDLERNDLGRVCQAGSVQVDELMSLETYAHVHHIVSNVKGYLKPRIGPGDLLKAMFPGGTITGCPKVRCMQILAELEQSPREAYTGSMGYVNHNGDMDVNILIRTMMLSGNELRFRAGGGIVMDSDPQRELLETRAKARGMIAALTLDSLADIDV